jgi:hypothetical protein
MKKKAPNIGNWSLEKIHREFAPIGLYKNTIEGRTRRDKFKSLFDYCTSYSNWVSENYNPRFFAWGRDGYHCPYEDHGPEVECIANWMEMIGIMVRDGFGRLNEVVNESSIFAKAKDCLGAEWFDSDIGSMLSIGYEFIRLKIIYADKVSKMMAILESVNNAYHFDYSLLEIRMSLVDLNVASHELRITLDADYLPQTREPIPDYGLKISDDGVACFQGVSLGLPKGKCTNILDLLNRSGGKAVRYNKIIGTDLANDINDLYKSITIINKVIKKDGYRIIKVTGKKAYQLCEFIPEPPISHVDSKK